MKSGYSPRAPGTVMATDLESPAECVPDAIAHVCGCRANQSHQGGARSPPDRILRAAEVQTSRFPSSQINERPEKGRPSKSCRDARAKLLAANPCAAHFAQAGFCLMRIALFLSR